VDFLADMSTTEWLLTIGAVVGFLFFVHLVARSSTSVATSGALYSNSGSAVNQTSAQPPARRTINKAIKASRMRGNSKSFAMSSHDAYGIVHIPKKPFSGTAAAMLVWTGIWLAIDAFVILVLLSFLIKFEKSSIDLIAIAGLSFFIILNLFTVIPDILILRRMSFVAAAKRVLIVGKHGLTFFGHIGPFAHRVDIAAKDLYVVSPQFGGLRIAGKEKVIDFLPKRGAGSWEVGRFIIDHTGIDESRLSDIIGPRTEGSAGFYFGGDTHFSRRRRRRGGAKDTAGAGMGPQHLVSPGEESGTGGWSDGGGGWGGSGGGGGDGGSGGGGGADGA